nr:MULTISPECIES: lysylphosphatidylglycerol synthase transmembrane domain-containing protein [unclassified Frankia]
MGRPGPGQLEPRRRGPRWWLARAALLLAVGLLGLALVGQWNAVRASFDELTVVSVAAAGGVTVLAVGTSVLSWRALLVGLGTALPLQAAVRVFFVGQIGKYVPGSVWPVLAQMELSRAYGVSRVKAASASLIVLALAVPCGGLAAAVTLPFVSATALGHYGWALLAVPGLAVVLYPPVLSRLLALAFGLLRRPPLERPLAVRPVLAGAGWLLTGFVLYGVATWLLVRDLAPSVHGPRLLLLAVGGYALAWTAGFLVPLVPAGAGVREAVLILALAPVLAHGPATLLALVSRLLATVADLLWAVCGAAVRTGGRELRAGGSPGLLPLAPEVDGELLTGDPDHA